MRMNDLSKQFSDARRSFEEDSQVASLMAGLRGSNIDDSDFADKSVVMRLVEVKNEEGEKLPQVYEPETIAEYWSRRPVSVATRSAQLLSESVMCSAPHLHSLSNTGIQAPRSEWLVAPFQRRHPVLFPSHRGS